MTTECLKKQIIAGFQLYLPLGYEKNELKAITGDSLYQREDGRYFLKIIGKSIKQKELETAGFRLLHEINKN